MKVLCSRRTWRCVLLGVLVGALLVGVLEVFHQVIVIRDSTESTRFAVARSDETSTTKFSCGVGVLDTAKTIEGRRTFSGGGRVKDGASRLIHISSHRKRLARSESKLSRLQIDIRHVGNQFRQTKVVWIEPLERNEYVRDGCVRAPVIHDFDLVSGNARTTTLSRRVWLERDATDDYTGAVRRKKLTFHVGESSLSRHPQRQGERRDCERAKASNSAGILVQGVTTARPIARRDWETGDFLWRALLAIPLWILLRAGLKRLCGVEKQDSYYQRGRY